MNLADLLSNFVVRLQDGDNGAIGIAVALLVVILTICKYMCDATQFVGLVHMEIGCLVVHQTARDMNNTYVSDCTQLANSI